eukprot:CAMPEP_0177645394 /NCGR_PEP_ID=MMETSP0447-20121125/9223_1 /TAXON_ID=0 /ORGANISM="Stygamoeba regulata, Strain BSH-02190019" /LENGTH=63 /DNA_ID=CAMNT_0019147869 /DNA_START=1 /DNA_END=192 /DNA_ORIENTATION=-
MKQLPITPMNFQLLVLACSAAFMTSAVVIQKYRFDKMKLAQEEERGMEEAQRSSQEKPKDSKA